MNTIFKNQKRKLAVAEQTYLSAVGDRKKSQSKLKEARLRFLGNPVNLLFPFTAGAIVCASQIKNNPEGVQRIPLVNLMKVGVGVWAAAVRIRRVKKSVHTTEPESTEPG